MRFIGLMPNDIYNADESYIRDHAGYLFESIVIRGDFDPHTYKYGSFIFYLGLLSYIPYMVWKYLLEAFQIIFFPVTADEKLITFRDFVEQAGAFHDVIPVIFLQRVSVAIIGIATIVVIYRIAISLFKKKTVAYSAALLLAVAPIHVRDSHYLTTDIPFTFFVLLAVYTMAQIIQTGRMKWYVLSGLAIGYSITIRYFPIALMAYPLAVLFDRHKTKFWPLKVMNGLLYTIIGVAAGVPFLVMNAQTNIPLFIEEMNKYVLPWYQTGLTSYLFSLVHYIATFGKSGLPPLSSLIPTYYRPTYISLLLFEAYGIVPVMSSLLGIGIGLLHRPKRTLFLLVIPLATFLYISYYIPAKYDRLVIPVLPFLALFAGIFFDYIWEFTGRLTHGIRLSVAVLTLGIMTYFPLTYSFASSIDCSKPHSFTRSVNWIDTHMADNSNVAYNITVSFPSLKPMNAITLRPDRSFFLEESRAEGAEYTFLNTTSLLYFMGTLSDNFIVPPPELYDNYFVNLAVYEYKTRAELLHEITSADMCAQPDMLFYKLKEEVPEAENLIHSFSFDDERDLSSWHVQEYTSIPQRPIVAYEPDEGDTDAGSLAADWQNVPYTPQRIMSENIRVTSGEIYTVKGSIKASEPIEEFLVQQGTGRRDGFLRIDFYTDEDADTSVPGAVVALTPRIYGDPQWRIVSVTVRAPENSVFAVISLQIAGLNPSTRFMFDDIKLYSSAHSLVRH
ncbi:MAG: glycosyltransferase family 39 protein [Candidatus Roizmanbacteria bacterium]|nr:glycosyltransferase family 39 protein [Candidatus Roizmanbacteria bacterium]